MRRFSDEVHVRSGGAARSGAADPPWQFVWRGRLYVVHDVLSYWRERSAWWEQDAVAAVHGDEPVPGEEPGGRRVLELGDLEREVWRVEAGVGRGGAVGVYDLARPVVPGTAAAGAVRGVVSEAAGSSGSAPQDTGADRPWQLLRVSD